jgi:hypothetical protein
VKKRKWERKRRRGKKNEGVGEKTNQREGERKRGEKESLRGCLITRLGLYCAVWLYCIA